MCSDYRSDAEGCGPPDWKYGRDKLGDADRDTVLTRQGRRRCAGESDGRLNGDNPFGGVCSNRATSTWSMCCAKWRARRAGSLAEVALTRAIGRRGVSSLLIGASRAEPVAQNIAALSVTLTGEQRAKLERAHPQISTPTSSLTCR